MKQRDIFLKGEGNAWFERNRADSDNYEPSADRLLSAIVAVASPTVAERPELKKLLEIGCGDGARLDWLQKHHQFECHGVDPSDSAVQSARTRGVHAHQGTADRLSFDDHEFDVVVFGFCLYLCDRDDLFRIASEADRVLTQPGWLLIEDFYSKDPIDRAYNHRAGIRTYKMDYTSLFTWHPAYTLYSQNLTHHSQGGYTDEPSEWVALSVLRKGPGPSV